MPKGFFITGTDTEIGKTTISLGLIAALQNANHTVSTMKPIASGCEMINGELRNDDALKLIKACHQNLHYKDVNPYAFEPPIAPHIAAEQAGININIPTICKLADTHKANSDYCIIEGVGGWQVPLNETETVEDLALALNLPVILVVGLRLGCINHALLTTKAIQDSGLILAGWVANHCHMNSENADEMIETLKQRINTPCLATVNYMEQIEKTLDIAKLTEP
ncbi:dethiobiotin synthase [Gammaproteobacteria bacterium AH-315-C21]|nr:dethiobiotin synthase [Gammaproteobacteria bacterium AH-315-C21]